MDQDARAFIPGLILAEQFFQDVIRPAIAISYPDLKYAAGILGEGSEVLGYDDVTSTDHCWGPRVMIFVDEGDGDLCADIRATLLDRAPPEFKGYRTDFECAFKSAVDVYTMEGFVRQTFGGDLPGETALSWLAAPAQRLLEFTSGRLFHDEVGLGALRDSVSYYPRDVWLYMLACQWARIGQEEPFVGRCGAVGDELGSQVVASGLVRDLMNLCFLMSRRYAPYSKWFGTAFGDLPCGPTLVPFLRKCLCAQTWQERESYLNAAYETVAKMHNDLGVTDSLPTSVSGFHDRPYLVIHGERFAEAIYRAIRDPFLQQMPLGVGSIDQFVDNTDVLSDAWRAHASRAWLEMLSQKK